MAQLKGYYMSNWNGSIIQYLSLSSFLPSLPPSSDSPADDDMVVLWATITWKRTAYRSRVRRCFHEYHRGHDESSSSWRRDGDVWRWRRFWLSSRRGCGNGGTGWVGACGGRGRAYQHGLSCRRWWAVLVQCLEPVDGQWWVLRPAWWRCCCWCSWCRVPRPGGGCIGKGAPGVPFVHGLEVFLVAVDDQVRPLLLVLQRPVRQDASELQDTVL